MADENPYDESTEEDSPVIKKLREDVKARDAELAEAREAKRQLAFIKAGVDIDSPVGKLFYKAYDGDLSDTDALVAAASEVGATGSNTPAPPQESSDPGESRQTAEREAIATGAQAETNLGEHPRDAALRAGEEVLKRGGTRQDALGEAFGVVASAAYLDGDERAMYKGNQG